MLNDTTILTELEAGTIGILPFSKSQLKGASYVLRLGRRYRRWIKKGDDAIIMWSPNAAEDALEPINEGDCFQLEPREYVLASTLERIHVSSNIVGQISPLSHVARFGLGITGGADLINPGFGNKTPSSLTLELYNHNTRPLVIRAGMPVAHLRFVRLSKPSKLSDQCSIYEGKDPLSAPLLYEEWHTAIDVKQ